MVKGGHLLYRQFWSQRDPYQRERTKVPSPFAEFHFVKKVAPPDERRCIFL